MLDQAHEMFVPGRKFDTGDLLFDLADCSLAMLLGFGSAVAMRRVARR